MQARVRLQVGLRICETPRDEGARYSQKGQKGQKGLSETNGFGQATLGTVRLVDADCRSHTILGTMGGGQKPTPTTEHRCRFVRAFRPRRNRSRRRRNRPLPISHASAQTISPQAALAIQVRLNVSDTPYRVSEPIETPMSHGRVRGYPCDRPQSEGHPIRLASYTIASERS